MARSPHEMTCARNRRSAVALLAPLLCLPLACGSPPASPAPGDDPAEEIAGKGDNLNGLTPTRELGLKLLYGYDRVLDLGRRKCVETVVGPDEPADYVAGFAKDTTTLHLISSRADLERELNLTVSAKAKLKEIGFDAGMELLRKVVRSSTSIYLLLKSRRSYSVVHQKPLRFNAEGLELLEGEPALFMAVCGTHYIFGQAYEAATDVLIRIDTSSLEQSKQISTSLGGLGLSVGPVTFDPQIASTLKEIAKSSGVETQLFLSSHGFHLPDSTLSTFSQPLSEQTFNVFDAIQGKMAQTISTDLCHDGGTGNCPDGVPARGYFANTARSALPVGVYLRPYSHSTLTNAPITPAAMERYIELDDLARMVSRYLEGSIGLHDRLSLAYAEELEPFLGRPDSYGSYRYHPPPTPPAATGIPLDALVEDAKEWASRFEPEKGTLAAPVLGLAEECWRQASLGTFSLCLREVSEVPEHRLAAEGLKEYVKDHRVRSLVYEPARIVEDLAYLRTWNYEAAERICSNTIEWPYRILGPGYRLPTYDEAVSLSLVALHHPSLPRNNEADGVWRSAIWYKESGHPAPCALRFNPDSSFQVSCGDAVKHRELTALCVPEAGVFGGAVPDL